MDKKHIIILKYLSEQREPVKLDNFPNAISSEYILGLQAGSLHFELGVTLRNKDWVKCKGVDDFFITDYAKLMIAPYLSNKSDRILEFLVPFRNNNFQNISPILSKIFPVNIKDFNELSEKGNEIRKLINGMVNDGLIKLDSKEINKLGNGHSGEREWLNNIKIMASMVKPAISQVTNNHIGNNNINTTSGDNSPITGRDFNQELKKKDDAINAMDEQLKAAQLELTLKQGELTALQVTETKNKKWVGVCSAIGGAILAVIGKYVIQKLIRASG